MHEEINRTYPYKGAPVLTSVLKYVNIRFDFYINNRQGIHTYEERERERERVFAIGLEHITICIFRISSIFHSQYYGMYWCIYGSKYVLES